MLSKESEERYHVVTDYTPTEARIWLVRGNEKEKHLKVFTPTIIDRLLGATLEKQIQKACKQAQTRCDHLNEKLDEMKRACT